MPRPNPSIIVAVSDKNIEIQPKKYHLKADVCTIGRYHTCDIVVETNIVSRLHAKIERHGPRYILSDTNSVNGTFVNDRPIREPYLLQEGDQIGLGGPVPILCFRDGDPTIALSTQQVTYNRYAMTFLVNDKRLTLTPVELHLFHFLYLHAGEICTRNSCAEAIWDREYDPVLDEDALNRAISNLRRKLRKIDQDAGDMIRTYRGKGYALYL